MESLSAWQLGLILLGIILLLKGIKFLYNKLIIGYGKTLELESDKLIELTKEIAHDPEGRLKNLSNESREAWEKSVLEKINNDDIKTINALKDDIERLLRKN